MSKIKIGACARSLGLPLRRALLETRKLALLGLEIDAVGDLAPTQLSQTGRRELRHLFSSHNLEFPAIGCPLRHALFVRENQEARLDHIRQVMTLAFDLGPRKVVLNAGPLPADDKDPRFALVHEALAHLSQHGDRIGVTLALDTGLEDGPAVDVFLNRFDTGSLAVTYNPGNLFMNGFDPYGAARALATRIVHVRVKDVRTSTASRTAQEVPLGHGDLDWMEVLGTLEEIGYRGWLDLERNASTTPLADIAAGVAFLRRLTGG